MSKAVCFLAGFLLCAGICTGAFFIFTDADEGRLLEKQLADSRAEVVRLGALVEQSGDISRREREVVARERAIIEREREDNNRTKVIYSELRNIVSGSYSDLDALDALIQLVKKLE